VLTVCFWNLWTWNCILKTYFIATSLIYSGNKLRFPVRLAYTLPCSQNHISELYQQPSHTKTEMSVSLLHSICYWARFLCAKIKFADYRGCSILIT
jgi:hypothetical protein